jgi:hypothetical protein
VTAVQNTKTTGQAMPRPAYAPAVSSGVAAVATAGWAARTDHGADVLIAPAVRGRQGTRMPAAGYSVDRFRAEVPARTASAQLPTNDAVVTDDVAGTRTWSPPV